LLVLNKLEQLLTVCKVKNIDDIDLSKKFYFIGKTDEEISLVCETNDVPVSFVQVDTLQKAKELPCVFNNFAVFYKGVFETVNFFTHWHSFKVVWNTCR